MACMFEKHATAVEAYITIADVPNENDRGFGVN